jgi:prepilin-type N-terminal cleavage/methylation domain-containing protein/prepilin-type processing-associated H-X9-DG protein
MRGLRCRGSGFTLIELLVVIAIIAILAAILFPVYTAAKENAKSARCSSNLWQMGTAVLLYIDSNNGKFPPSSHNDNIHLIAKLQRYCSSQLLYRCPSDLSKNFEQPLHNYRTLRKSSYGSNFYMTPYSLNEEPDGTHGFTNVSMFRHPTRTIYVAELKRNSVADHFHPAYWTMGTRDPDYDGMAMTVHGDRANYLFLDGHVKLMLFDETWKKDGSVNLYDP